ARFGGAHSPVAAVQHLKVLHREFDVGKPAASELEIVSPRPLATELALHAHADAMNFRFRRRASFVGGNVSDAEQSSPELAVAGGEPRAHQGQTLPGSPGL